MCRFRHRVPVPVLLATAVALSGCAEMRTGGYSPPIVHPQYNADGYPPLPDSYTQMAPIVATVGPDYMPPTGDSPPASKNPPRSVPGDITVMVNNWIFGRHSMTAQK